MTLEYVDGQQEVFSFERVEDFELKSAKRLSQFLLIDFR